MQIRRTDQETRIINAHMYVEFTMADVVEAIRDLSAKRGEPLPTGLNSYIVDGNKKMQSPFDALTLVIITPEPHTADCACEFCGLPDERG